jgi:RNA polymerase-binding transcription factor DksA
MDDTDGAELEAGTAVTDDAPALLESLEQRLSAIEDALRRLDGDGWGRCTVCGQPLAVEVLTDDPTVVACPEHRSPAGEPD